MARHPAFLLELARVERGVSGLDADELRGIAVKHWPKASDEEIDQLVDQAIEHREQNQRRIDPATVDIRDPRRKRSTMAETKEVRRFIRLLLEDDPEISNDEINREVNKRFESEYSQQQTSAHARFARQEIEAATRKASTNGAKPAKETDAEPPKDPPAGAAEPVDSPQATEPVEGEVGGMPARHEAAEVTKLETEIPGPTRETQTAHIRSEARIGRFGDRLSVDVDPERGDAHLFVDVSSLRPADAYAIQAEVAKALGRAAAEAA